MSVRRAARRPVCSNQVNGDGGDRPQHRRIKARALRLLLSAQDLPLENRPRMFDAAAPLSDSLLTQLNLAQARILELERRVQESETRMAARGLSAPALPARRPGHQGRARDRPPPGKVRSGDDACPRLGHRVRAACMRAGEEAPQRLYAACSVVSAAAFNLARREGKATCVCLLEYLSGTSTNKGRRVGAESAPDDLLPWVYVEAGGTVVVGENAPYTRVEEDPLEQWENEWCTIDGNGSG